MVWGRKPIEKSSRRCKIMFMGKWGTAKTPNALEWPRCAYIDNHRSAAPYETSFPEHRFSNPKNADDHTEAIISLAKNPEDRLTAVIDDASVYYDQIRDKWHNLFLTRLRGGKGHHLEFYTNQPGDWEHPKRELKRNISILINMDINLILIARLTNEYAGGSSSDFMKIIGTTFDGDKSLGHDIDYIFELINENGKRSCKVRKQRIDLKAGEKLFPQTFDFEVGGFYKIFLEHVNQDLLMRKATPMSDEELIVEEDLSGTGNITKTSSEPEITHDQLSRCVELKDKLKMDNKLWAKAVAIVLPGATSVKTFTPEQVDILIEGLEKELKNRPTQGQQSSKS